MELLFLVVEWEVWIYVEYPYLGMGRCGYTNVIDNQKTEPKLNKLKNIERVYFDLFEKRISIEDFENIIYYKNWPKEELSSSEYDELLSINYSDKEAKFNIKKILANTINYQEILAKCLNSKLDSIKEVKLDWKIETYEYGTRYGIVAQLDTKTNFKFIEPIESSVHKNSPYYTKKGIYDKLERTLNDQLPNVQALKNLLTNLRLGDNLIFCYKHDVDEFNRYYNYDNGEFKFQIEEILGKIRKEKFMNELKLHNE